MADKRRSVIAFLFLATFFGFVVLSPLGGQATAGDWFGAQGSISGDTYLVGQRYGEGIPGSPTDVGSVHVFVRESPVSESWLEIITLESLLNPGSLVSGAQFGGGAVLIDGDTAVVGAYRNTVGGSTQAGNAFVFTRSGSTWSAQTMLEMPGGALGSARFGATGDIDGDRLLLSAPGANGAYIFSKSGESWDSGIELSGGNIDVPLGVAIDGDWAAVGNFGSNPHVDMWQYNQVSGNWDFKSAIANPGATGNHLGSSIDISGNTMVVSARQETVAGQEPDVEYTCAGSVYVYQYAAGSWSLQETIENPTPATSDEFGYDVAIEGNRLVVGAPRVNHVVEEEVEVEVEGEIIVVLEDVEKTDAGEAYVYLRSGSTWALDETYMSETPETGMWFGEIVDLSGDVLLAGGSGRTADPVGSGEVCWFDLESIPSAVDFPGDANNDGIVNELDAMALAANWQNGPDATWAEGDFNDDGWVNDVDATIMASHWGMTGAMAIPEPGTFALLLGLMTMVLLPRRK